MEFLLHKLHFDMIYIQGKMHVKLVKTNIFDNEMTIIRKLQILILLYDDILIMLFFNDLSDMKLYTSDDNVVQI